MAKIKYDTGMVLLEVPLGEKLAMGCSFQKDMTICCQPILRDCCVSSDVSNDAYYQTFRIGECGIEWDMHRVPLEIVLGDKLVMV